MKKVAVEVVISGKVQGVYFRVYILRKAEELGITGWVKNLESGQVKAFLEGGKKQVEVMLDCCKQGSPGSKVSQINVIRKKEQGLREFTIVK